MDGFDQLFEILAAQGLVIFSGKIKRFRDTGTAKCCEEGSLHFLGRQWGTDGEVVCHYEAVIVLREVRKGQRIKNLVREGRDDGWFC